MYFEQLAIRALDLANHRGGEGQDTLVSWNRTSFWCFTPEYDYFLKLCDDMQEVCSPDVAGAVYMNYYPDTNKESNLPRPPTSVPTIALRNHSNPVLKSD